MPTSGAKKKIRLRKRRPLLPFFTAGAATPSSTQPAGATQKPVEVQQQPAGATQKPVEVQQQQVEKPLKLAVKRGGVDLSLGAALSKKGAQGAQQVQETVRKRTSEVTEDGIRKLWNSFPSQIREMQSLHFVFAKQPAWDAENKIISVEVDSRVMAEQLNSILPRLTKYMRDGLQNDSVNIETKIAESHLSSRDLTPKGKAQAMAKKNEKLRDLCRRLNLGFA